MTGTLGNVEIEGGSGLSGHSGCHLRCPLGLCIMSFLYRCPIGKFTFRQFRQMNPDADGLWIVLNGYLERAIAAGHVIGHNSTTRWFKNEDTFTTVSQPPNAKLVKVPRRPRKKRSGELVGKWIGRLIIFAVLIPIVLVVAILGLMALIGVAMIPLVGPVLAFGILWFMGVILKCKLSGGQS